ncbi:MAG TPA: crossover junction endodeoxyribonuclease RuvC [Clostridiales bacterium UBA8153]|nr:crossover junction endodeoxyribonuclease RuvC [Clostridiales bacterium UBA8153]
MLVLGVDPGSALVGYGLVRARGQRLEALEYGCVRSVSAAYLPANLLQMYTAISRLIAVHQPSVVSVEQVFFNRNVRTALAVGQARGTVLLAAASAGVRVEEYTPTQVKSAVAGYARADKRQMQAVVKSILGLPELPTPDDVADALACAITCVHTMQTAARLENRAR